MGRRKVVGRLSKVLMFVVVLVVAAASVAVAANRIGDNNANTLNGTDLADAVYGLGGPDILNAGLGNDEVSGNPGNDRLNGSNGDDVMVGGTGSDRINTGNSVNTGSGREDFVYAFDGFADTVCVGQGDWFARVDGNLDTVLGPPTCQTVIHDPPTTAAANDAGNDGALTLSSADR